LKPSAGALGFFFRCSSVWLAERAVSVRRIDNGDAVLRVAVNGKEWYCDKAKNEKAEDLGVERCLNGFFVEVLCKPTESA
jgi:hypothetical protein